MVLLPENILGVGEKKKTVLVEMIYDMYLHICTIWPNVAKCFSSVKRNYQIPLIDQ